MFTILSSLWKIPVEVKRKKKKEGGTHSDKNLCFNKSRLERYDYFC